MSEGVDVPALDAVLFLNPRNSVIDVVQSVEFFLDPAHFLRRQVGQQLGC